MGTPAQLSGMDIVEQLRNLRNLLINPESAGSDERMQLGLSMPAKMKLMSTIESGESDCMYTSGTPYRARRASYNLSIGVALQTEIEESQAS